MYFINNVSNKVKKILFEELIYIFYLFTLVTKACICLCTTLILDFNHFQTLDKYFVFVVIMA